MNCETPGLGKGIIAGSASLDTNGLSCGGGGGTKVKLGVIWGPPYNEDDEPADDPGKDVSGKDDDEAVDAPEDAIDDGVFLFFLFLPSSSSYAWSHARLLFSSSATST